MSARFLLTAILAAAAAVPAHAGAVRDNAGFRQFSVPRNDDGSSSLESIGFTVNFFGRIRDTLFVNNNGNITLDSSLSTFTPFGLTSTQREIIAAFFADVDTRAARSALVTYGRDSIDGRQAFGVNYVNVGYYDTKDDQLNSFQLILIDRSDTGAGNFDIEFNYDRIVWETGSASGGVGGRGGTSAAVGWSNGTGFPGTSFELPGSLVPGSFLDSSPRGLARNRLNSNVPGRYRFRARDGRIDPGLAIQSACPAPPAVLGNSYRHQMTATGDMPPYRWSQEPDPGTSLPGLTLASSGLLSGVPTSIGTYFFTVKVTARSEDGDVTLTRRCSVTVTPPQLSVATSCPLPGGTAGVPYAHQLQAAGGRGAYSWSTDTGEEPVPGIAITPEGILHGTPTRPGTYVFGLRVGEGEEALPGSRRCSLTIRALPLGGIDGSGSGTGSGIGMTPCPLPGATAGVPYSQVLVAGGGEPPYAWSVAGSLPPGLGLNPRGVISGIPQVPAAFPFTLRVSDSRGASLQQTCSIGVAQPEVRITTACPLPDAATGTLFRQTLQAAGGAGHYRWSIAGSLPSGLTLSRDGVLSGNPTIAGPSQFRLIVEDGAGRPASVPCSLAVQRGPMAITSCPLPAGAFNRPYSHSLAVEGGEGPYTWSLTGRLPEGLVFAGTGRLSGTPRGAGEFPFVVQASDSRGRTATQACRIQVEAPTLSMNTACPLAPATLGSPVSASFTAAGGVAPYTWWADGSLPKGLELSSDGALSGTPETTGSSTFTVFVQDSLRQLTGKECALTVLLPELPSVRLLSLPSLQAPASTGIMAGVTLSRPYTLPIQGVLELDVAGDTGTIDPQINHPDPRVRLANGQMTASFTIPPGATEFRIPLASTGTVASTITARLASLRAGGAAVNRLPPPVEMRVARSAPVLTNACFTPRSNGIDLVVTGYSTTRDLVSANVSAGSSRSIDLAAVSGSWFQNDESVPHGGAFTLTIPIPDAPATGSVSVSLLNLQGASASRQAQRCQ